MHLDNLYIYVNIIIALVGTSLIDKADTFSKVAFYLISSIFCIMQIREKIKNKKK